MDINNKPCQGGKYSTVEFAMINRWDNPPHKVLYSVKPSRQYRSRTVGYHFGSEGSFQIRISVSEVTDWN